VQTLFLCWMKTLKDVSATFIERLSPLYDLNEINSLCLIVLAEIEGISSAKIKAFPETEISRENVHTINHILERLSKGEPVQYILGHTEFFGLPFKVNPSVLIPRPETEELVDWTIESWRRAKGNWLSPCRILDIGTGSGCIAVSLKKNLQETDVSAMDISQTALLVARENTRLNQVDIRFINADILNLESEFESQRFEIIISNPPYVTLEDKKTMHSNVTDFEPHTALFVPEDNPLIFYKAIADFAFTHLEKGGLLFFEINESFDEQTVEMLSDKQFKNIELRKDMSGKYRMVKAQLT
jgi:release factor glutamine methyltransferase